jgi:predicted 2-oxoglutarate/Fe(II)-dependent dioxygenase YbiX
MILGGAKWVNGVHTGGAKGVQVRNNKHMITVSE